MNNEHSVVYSFREYKVDLEDIMFMLIVFEKILERITSREDRFMCSALNWIRDQDNSAINTNIIEACRRYIYISIDHNFTFETWLKRNWEEYDDRNYGESNDTAIKARIIWLKANIARFTEILKEHHYPF